MTDIQFQPKSEILYALKDLSVEYLTREGAVHAVNDVNLEIKRGEILGLVGESGCGKSTLGRAMLRMLGGSGRIVAGELNFDGEDLVKISERQMRKLRGAKLGMVFQDPMTSLNPVQRISVHLTETMTTHMADLSEDAAHERAQELGETLGIRRDRLDDYPHQFSGGMRQRAMISLALAVDADLVIADEPTTSLDVIVEAKFLDLLRELQQELGLTIVMITHNIGVVAEISDRVAVMYAGRLVELGPVEAVFQEPKHPYTKGLLKSVPNIELSDDELYKMEGQPPNLSHLAEGCPFAPRCPDALDICTTAVSPITGDEHQTECWLFVDDPTLAAAQ